MFNSLWKSVAWQIYRWPCRCPTVLSQVMKSASNTTLQRTAKRRPVHLGGRRRTSDRRRRQGGGLSLWRRGARPSNCWAVTRRCCRTSSRTAPSVRSTLSWLNARRRRRRARTSRYCAALTAPAEPVSRCYWTRWDLLDSISWPTCLTTRRGSRRCRRVLNRPHVHQVTYSGTTGCITGVVRGCTECTCTKFFLGQIYREKL